MKNFIIKLVLFGFIFFVLDKFLIVIRNSAPDNEVDKRLEWLIKGEINKDVVILGSSRGARNIIASQIEEATNLSTFNLSYPGSNIEFHEFLLRTLLKFNKKPKQVILVVDEPYELTEIESLNFRFDRLYPLVKYDYIREELISRGEKNIILSKLFVLHQLNKSNFDLRKKTFQPQDTVKSCGSMPLTEQRKGRKWTFDKLQEQYTIEKEEENKVNAFKSFVSICKEENVSLAIAFPPNFRSYNKSFDSRIKQLIGNDAGFIIYDSLNRAYFDKSFFYDEAHLLRAGAEIFTNEIIDFLKKGKVKITQPTTLPEINREDDLMAINPGRNMGRLGHE